MKARLIALGMATAMILTLGSCQNFLSSDKSNKSDETPDKDSPEVKGGTTLKFDLKGAKAVGSVDINAGRQSRATEADAYGLVKVLEDGTVQLAMEAPEGVWMPKITFIAHSPVADAKDLYVAFENNISYWDQTQNKQVNVGSFLHIRADGAYFSVVNKADGTPENDGRVKNTSWYGNDAYRPVSFDAQGRIYFVWESWSGSSNSNRLFQYDPVTHVTTPLTASLSGYQYDNFEVSPDGSRLFVQGQRITTGGGTGSKFFRVYPVADITNPASVFYTSNSTTWIRGYKVAPNGSNVILNGWNIRGINGLLKATVATDNSISYSALFDSNTQNWFNPDYNEWYSDWEAKTYYDGYFDRINVSETYFLMTDGANFYYLSLGDLRNPAKGWDTSPPQLWQVFKDPSASDWSARGQTQKTLNPTTTGSLWFASGETDPSGKILDGTAGVPNWTGYSAVTYYNNVRGQATPKTPLVYTFVRRWVNGVEKVTRFPLTLDAATTILGNSEISAVYQWNTHWFKTNPTTKVPDRTLGLDWDAVLTYAGKYFLGDVRFKYKANEAGAVSQSAFATGTAPGATNIYTEPEIKGSYTEADRGQFYLLKKFFVKADGVTPAVTFRDFKEANGLNWLNFQNVGTLFYDATGACWAIFGGSQWGGSSSKVMPAKILDPAGVKTLEFIPALNDNTYNPVSYLMSGNQLYFRDGIRDGDGFETGYHRLYRLDVTTPGVPPVDVLAGALGADNGKIEIVSFSVGSTALYFTGVKGTGVVGGKIDLATGVFTPFPENYSLKALEIF